MRRSRKRNIRSRARKSKFDTVYTRFQGRCYYCDKPVVRIRGLCVIKEDHSYVTFTRKGKIEKWLIASLDHLQKIRNNRSNRLENIVLSCKICNEGREKHRSNSFKLGIIQANISKTKAKSSPVCMCGADKAIGNLVCYNCKIGSYLTQAQLHEFD